VPAGSLLFVALANTLGGFGFELLVQQHGRAGPSPSEYIPIDKAGIYLMMYLLQYRRACLAFPEALKLKLYMNPERGFSRYDRIELNKMIDFYRTQDLRKHFSEKADLLAVQNIVIQYDPSEDAIHILKIAIEDEEDDVFSLAPLSLEPKLNTLPMLSGGPRRLWIDPATDSARNGDVADYFEEEAEHDDESDDGEGTAREGGGNFSESGSDFGF
jgi:hypothetical protein